MILNGFQKIIFQNRYVELETPPPFMEKTILNFHFDYSNPSLKYHVHCSCYQSTLQHLVHISIVVDRFACRLQTSSRSFQQQESRPVDNIRDLNISRVGSCSPHSGLVPRVNVINKLIKTSHHYVSMHCSILWQSIV